MKRLLLVLLGLILISPIFAIAQVKINIPGQHFGRLEEIHAEVKNAGRQPVTLRLVLTSMGGISPTPFGAQRNNGGRWGTLLLGDDSGPNGWALVLKAGESEEFPFHLNDSGKMRLILNYWRGAKPNLSCTPLPKGSKVVTSTVFAIE